ncbi:hypothetical protein LCGC14_0978780 [marine sediment metagenome]|uniref:Uncharacterized protein n=1 Tax=marine sediment metagenome TaxID=412755 RepID=A0A0F9QSQ1_9ZZZZ
MEDVEITACMMDCPYCFCYDCTDGIVKVRREVGIEMKRRLNND